MHISRLGMCPIETRHLVLSYLLFCMLLCALSLFPNVVSYRDFSCTAYASQLSSSGNNTGGNDNSTGDDNINDTPYGLKRESSQPIINDPNLKLELVAEGLQLPSQMAFIGPNDILVLEKDTGMVKRIINGVILNQPILDVNVSTAYERGLLGIAITENINETAQRNASNVYLYYTESEQDANDVCSDTGTCNKKNEPLGNRLYRYELVDNKLVNPHLLLDLPASPGAVHNGGAILIGPDNNMYIPIGEVGYQSGQISNNAEGRPSNRTGGILRVTQQGEAVGTWVNGGDKNNGSDHDINLVGIIGHEDPLNKYYAYGIRNSFGLDFDPVAGNLWDTENGPGFGDEINLVEPGFNSGWNRVQGIWEYQLKSEEKLRDVGQNYYGGPVASEEPNNLVDFGGRGKYSTPEFIWNQTVGVTAIKFLNSDKLGKDYQNNMFAGDIHNGNLYHFDLSKDRKQLLLDGPLKDRIANNQTELQGAILGQGFNGITDIEVGPDGYLYVLSFAGSIFRISS
jgi:glucose/arabinose dehydrogenase